MATQNGFDDLVIKKNEKERAYSLAHLEGLSVAIQEFRFEDGRVGLVEVHVRPTNHVYSRKLEGTDNYTAIEATGELLIKYEHHQDNPQQIKKDALGNPKIDSDKRVFCPDKYQYSKLLPSFVGLLEMTPNHVSVLPNKGDSRTCLSALFALPQEAYPESHCYLVFFTLHKKSSCTMHMVIETAFVVDEDHMKAKLLTNSKHHEQRRPFIILLRNIFAGRNPFESKERKQGKKALKRNKGKK